jgi:hypothetical protein
MSTVMTLKVVIITILLAFFSSCTSSNNPQTDAKSFMETMEFEGDEYGEITITGDVTLGNGIPFFGTEVHLDYRKIKDAPAALDTP